MKMNKKTVLTLVGSSALLLGIVWSNSRVWLFGILPPVCGMLLAVAGAAVVAIIAYNWWQTSHHGGGAPGTPPVTPPATPALVDPLVAEALRRDPAAVKRLCRLIADIDAAEKSSSALVAEEEEGGIIDDATKTACKEQVVKAEAALVALGRYVAKVTATVTKARSDYNSLP